MIKRAGPWLRWLGFGRSVEPGAKPAAQASSSDVSASATPAIAALVSVHEVGLGVLGDGRPFLTPSGLARLLKFVSPPVPAVSADMPSGPRTVHLISDVAAHARDGFVTVDGDRFTAVELAEFVFVQTGFADGDALPAEWRHFHAQINLVHNYAPSGLFTVPKELTDLAVALARRGGPVVGDTAAILAADALWWDHWDAEWLAARFPPRQRYAMAYPGFLPHASTAMQSPHSFPIEALGTFRDWILTSDVCRRLGLDPAPMHRVGWRWPLSLSQLAGPVPARQA